MNVANSPRRRTLYWLDEAKETITARDLYYVCTLPLLAIVAWLVPERHWSRLCNVAGSFGVRALRRHSQGNSNRAEQIIGNRACVISPGAVERGLFARLLEDRIGLFREYRPGGWQVEWQVDGAEKIDAARQHGRGVILWVSDFVYSSLLTKKVLHAAGFEVSHLSRPGHGFSRSRFGQRFLNPIQTTIEDRHLYERVLIHGDRSADALQRLRQHLYNNSVVSITAGREAKRPMKLAFMNGSIALAVGAPKLAASTGAPIFPIFTVRDDSSGVCTVHVGQQISVGGSENSKIEKALAEYVTQLEEFVISYPDQWRGWLFIDEANEGKHGAKSQDDRLASCRTAG